MKEPPEPRRRIIRGIDREELLFGTPGPWDSLDLPGR
jgi:hypothetical protein